MKSDTRKRMVEGAAYLMRRRGVSATSLRDVVAHSGASRGSISHHFPSGKQQLMEEAVVFAGQEVSLPLKHLMATKGAVEGMRKFLLLWQKMLEDSDFEAGCPVLVAAIEPEVQGDRRAPTEAKQPGDQHLLAISHQVFSEWLDIIAEALEKEGAGPQRARSLAALCVAAVEGSVALCRAAHSCEPLEQVREEVLALFAQP